MISIQARILGGVSVAALAVTAFPALASAQGTRTAAEQAEACTTLPTQVERDACLRSVGAVDPDTPQEGDIATLSPAEQAQRQAQQGGGQNILVTGSRLRRSPFNSPDPLTVIDPLLSLQEGNIETAEILQTSIVAAGSTQITSFLSSNFVTNGGPGAQTLSLRGLGAGRTLVLLNGRRAGPAGTRGAIASFDLNVLPSSIVQSVEILKTGASSVYGSDAIAGVVNILTRRSTNGIEFRAFTSLPFESGGEAYDVSATYGREFGRGHFLVSANYFRRNELERQDRDYLGCTIDLIYNEAGERVDLLDPRTGEPYCGGDAFGGAISISNFLPNLGIPNNLAQNQYPGALFAISLIQPNVPGSRVDEFGFALRPPNRTTDCRIFGCGFGAPSSFYGVNVTANSTGILNLYNQFPAQQRASVIPQTERWSIFGIASYEITDTIEIFGEFLYNNRQTYNDSFRQIFPQQFTSNTVLPLFFCPNANDSRPCNPNSIGDPINVGFTGDVIMQPVVVTDRFDTETDVDYYRGVVGLRGDFGRIFPTWTWNGWAQYSRSEGEYTFDVIFQDSFDTFNLRTESCAGTVTAVRGVPCVDINFTDPRVLFGNFTPEEEAFLFGKDTGNTLFTQWTGEFSASGELWQVPAGVVQAALGVQWRRDEIDDVPGPATLTGNSWGLTGAGRTAGFAVTKEAFAEIEIPLIHNAPVVQMLTLSAAARLTNYTAQRFDFTPANPGLRDTDNGNWTYKLGLNWQVNDWVRFRGTYGTSFRAPALFEQFLQDQTGFLAQTAIDPCLNIALREAQGTINPDVARNCRAAGVPDNYTGGGTSSALILTGGGIGVLEPETSRAMTASVIFTPPGWLWRGGRLSVAVDYFDISIEGEIATLGSANIVGRCYSSEFFPNDPLCNLFERVNDPNDPRDNQILFVRNSFLNINRQDNRGIDVTARFNQDLGSLGSLQLLAQMTWQLEDRIGLFVGTEIDDNGEMGDPKWIGDFNLTWRRQPFTVVYGLNVIGGTSDEEDVLRVSGSLCQNNAFRGRICPDFRGEPTFYHSLSVTANLMQRFDFTVGVNNIFDTPPPTVSRINSQTGGSLGQVPILGSQYDYLGRRVFIAITGRI